MSTGPLKAAVIGLSGWGSLMAESAAESGLYKIEVAADKDIDAAQKFARVYEAQACDDYRLALSSKDLDVVLLGAGLSSSFEHIKASASRKLHILRAAPPARSMDELAGLVSGAQEAGVKFSIASPGRASGGIRAITSYLKEKSPEGIFLITAQVGLSKYQDLSARDPKLSGGGVLLHSGYQMLDLIMGLFGVPSQVYCWQTSQAPDRQQRMYVTEDTAVLNMKFSDTLLANVMVSKSFVPGCEFLKIHAKESSLTLIDNRFVVQDASGKVVEEQEIEIDEQKAMVELVSNFSRIVAGDAEAKAMSSAESHLATMSVVDAAYLSARTGMPESPLKISELSSSGANRILNAAIGRTV